MNHEEEISFAVSVLEKHIKIHEDWATYFELHPKIEAEHVATGTWDSAKIQRDIASKYKRIAAFLKNLRGSG